MTRHERIQKEIISVNKEIEEFHCSGITDSETVHKLPPAKPTKANANGKQTNRCSNKLKV
ncbi:MAG: hypothetical protein B6D68_02540 [spirochete symbiont of Stewartia floridana]|nr:MAG: hypothetical protein B6D68_02540 [spirochete symbiont of Stewartia floridana]